MLTPSPEVDDCDIYVPLDFGSLQCSVMVPVHALDAEARLAAKRKEIEAVKEKARPIQLEVESPDDDNFSDEENLTAPTKSSPGACRPPSPPPPSPPPNRGRGAVKQRKSLVHHVAERA